MIFLKAVGCRANESIFIVYRLRQRWPPMHLLSYIVEECPV
jgi:hypothetical protein